MNKYIVASIKDWNIDQFHKSKPKNNNNWFLITDPKKLTFKYVNSINPDFIFFPHWSEKVNKKITSNFKCVCFHETDLPYGRGGSPIQNLIIRDKSQTFISAIRMTDILDAGPVYIKRRLKLTGTAQEIYERAARIVFKMIKIIIKYKLKPIPQKGKVVYFKRRNMKQSILPKNTNSLKKIFDYIRMLDAKTYPKAFIKHGNLKIEFKKARVNRNSIDAHVNIKFISKK